MNRIKTLRHYHRKRFFYRFFCMRSPRSGAMTGLAWLMFVWELFPVFMWKMVPVVAQKGAAVSSLIKFFLFIVFPSFLIWLYGITTYYHNLYLLQRKHFAKKKIFRFSAFISAILFPLSGILTAILLLKSRCFLFMFAALGSIAAAILPFFEFIEIPTTVSLLFLSMSILLLISIFGMKDQRKFRKTFLVPVGLLLFYAVGMCCWYLHLTHSIDASKKTLSALAGHSISPEAFWKRNEKGVPVTAPPLQKLTDMFQRDLIDDDLIETSAAAKEKWIEYRKEHKQFLDAVEDFLKLSPQRIRYQKRKSIDIMILPDINPFREAARFYALEIRAFPTDKKRIRNCNSQILKLRDWALYNETLVGKLVAISLESGRLSTLSDTFFRTDWTKDEMLSLIGEPVDWKKQLCISFGMESAMFESVIQLFMKTTAEELSDTPSNDMFNGIIIGYFFIPFFMRIHTLADFHNAVKVYENICNTTRNKKVYEIGKIDSDLFSSEKNRRNSFYISAILCPTLHKAFSRFAQILDHWQMTQLTVEIADYYRKEKRLPENLNFLSNIPVDSQNGKPFQYKKTKDGFQLYPLDKNGKRPEEERYYHKVQIEK